MNYLFSPDARVDLLAAAKFYETQQPGLRTEFAVDVGLAWRGSLRRRHGGLN
jgi:hypothetical protein